MQFSDYRDKYHTIRLTRSGEGVLELAMHRRVGESKWDTSTRSLSLLKAPQCHAF